MNVSNNRFPLIQSYSLSQDVNKSKLVIGRKLICCVNDICKAFH